MSTATETRSTTTATLALPPADSALEPDLAKFCEQIPAEMDYVDHPSFPDPQTETRLFGAEVAPIVVPEWTHFPEAPEDLVQTRKGRKALSGRDEVTLFLRYNYARYRLSQLMAAQKRRVSSARARLMAAWYRRMLDARSDIVNANMALVMAMAKRTKIPNVEFTEVISEGNMALLRSVEKFDVSRGFKFSTYACRAILKSFNRMATKTGKYHQHFPTEYDPDLETSDYDLMKHDIQRADSIDALREILAKNRAKLSPVEQTIVIERFAIASRGKGRTLAEVGKMVGLTNERVRQIQNLALQKIKDVLDDDYLFIPSKNLRDE